MSRTINTDLQNEALALAARKNALARNHGDDSNGLDALVDNATVLKDVSHRLSSPLQSAELTSYQYKQLTYTGSQVSTHGRVAANIGPIALFHGFSYAAWLTPPQSDHQNERHFFSFHPAQVAAGFNDYRDNAFAFGALCAGYGPVEAGDPTQPMAGPMPVANQTFWYPRPLDMSVYLASTSGMADLNYWNEKHNSSYIVTVWYT